jgi:hypothetical protein
MSDEQAEAPKGKLMRAVDAFKAFMGALRGGGVWAALTLCLLVAGYQAWRIEQLNQQIIEILVADKQEETTRIAARVAHPVEFEPRRVIGKYHEMYQPQVEQRIADFRPRPAGGK